jgi:hypothetical protein
MVRSASSRVSNHESPDTAIARERIKRATIAKTPLAASTSGSLNSSLDESLASLLETPDQSQNWLDHGKGLQRTEVLAMGMWSREGLANMVTT